MLPITMTTPASVKLLASQRSDKSSKGSEIDEARNLVKRCAEPTPAGDSVKAAISRAAYRLGFSYSRTRNLWYGEARRIDAREMDALRAGAAVSEIDQGISNLKTLRERLSKASSPVARQALDGIDAALGVLVGSDQRNSDVEA